MISSEIYHYFEKVGKSERKKRKSRNLRLIQKDWHFHRKFRLANGFLVPLILPQDLDFSFAEHISNSLSEVQACTSFFPCRNHVTLSLQAKALTHSRPRARFKFFCEKAASARTLKRKSILRQISIFKNR